MQKVKISTEIENTKKCQTEIMKLKNSIIKLEKSLKELNSILDQEEDRIREVKNKLLEII